MEMPHIQTCDVEECAYNRHRECHALAITVGGPEGEPLCDTFWTKQKNMKGGDPTQMGHVGACHMAGCMYNDRLECVADGITVAHKGDKPDCLTFNPDD